MDFVDQITQLIPISGNFKPHTEQVPNSAAIGKCHARPAALRVLCSLDADGYVPI